ncbi:hypothetical protein LJC51_07450 [Lachnospiraceae bacterium OttesenSCG-928-J05]|nr:hypothetical protein [Lachnospiraceae bacterium OttesenSCG-928-J05]
MEERTKQLDELIRKYEKNLRLSKLITGLKLVCLVFSVFAMTMMGVVAIHSYITGDKISAIMYTLLFFVNQQSASQVRDN